jgi:hypothetical protein
MNVHLLKSPELSEDTYRDVVHVLRQYPGPIRFIESELGIMDAEPKDHYWQDEKKFDTKDNVVFPQYSLIPDNEMWHSFPMTDQRLTWQELFRQCENYRVLCSVPTDDHVILLTNIGNDKNWFGSIDESLKNYFIHTENWSHYFQNQIDVRFPIAYEVIVWLLRGCIYSSRYELQQHLHTTSIGCFMDYCENKKEIILKMRTADICPSCLDHINQKDLPSNFVNQILDTMDGIRNNLIFRERVRIMRRPSRIQVEGFMKKIYLTDFGNLEVRLNPKERSLYLLYLNHPEGISLPELYDHRGELLTIYQRLSGRESNEDMQRTIQSLVNPIESDINVNLSRIRKKFKDAVGEELLHFYDITGEHGAEKSIKLDRELVTYKD